MQINSGKTKIDIILPGDKMSDAYRTTIYSWIFFVEL